jgi:hypothetical protein
MASHEYLALLRDPRWQKKRLEVMSRDGFMCQWCCAEDKTLNVHHTYYRRGAAPWDYPTESLVTLCEDCHETKGEETRKALQHWSGVAAAKGIADEVIAYIRARASALSDVSDRIPVVSSQDLIGISAALPGETALSISQRAKANGGWLDPAAVEREALERYRSSFDTPAIGDGAET